MLRRSLTLCLTTASLTGCTAADITSLDRFAATGELVALSGAGAGAANACVTCHGLQGQGDGAGAPRLAGLDAGYLERQLGAYAEGQRYHPQMAWIAGRLSERERVSVSIHYANLPFNVPATGTAGPEGAALYHRGDPARGLPSCASCHGSGGAGIGPANPPLAGQSEAYLGEQMDQWRTGRRRTDPGAVMMRISQLLTPAEARAVTAYAARLDGRPANPESPAASRAAHRADPRSDASGPPLHVPESARAAE